MNKKTLKYFKTNEKKYNELAEKRTIESLGLTDREVTIAKAFETTKVVELSNIKDEILQLQSKKLILRSVLWKL